MSSDRITRLKALQAAAGGKTIAARDAVALIRPGDTSRPAASSASALPKRSPSRLKNASSDSATTRSADNAASRAT